MSPKLGIHPDDAAAAGSTANIRCWWDIITKGGPMFGYYSYPNASKTHLIVKQEYVQSANDLFEGTGITVITFYFINVYCPECQLYTRVDSKKSFCRSVTEGTYCHLTVLAYSTSLFRIGPR